MLQLADSSANCLFHHMTWCDGPYGFSCKARFVLVNDTIYILIPRGNQFYAARYRNLEGGNERFESDEFEYKFVSFCYADLLNIYLVESENPVIFGLVNDRSEEFYAKIEEISHSFIAEGGQIQKGMLEVDIKHTISGDGFRDVEVSVVPSVENDDDVTLASLAAFDPASPIGIEIIQTVKENFPVR
jgi:hypothetical protein